MRSSYVDGVISMLRDGRTLMASEARRLEDYIDHLEFEIKRLKGLDRVLPYAGESSPGEMLQRAYEQGSR